MLRFSTSSNRSAYSGNNTPSNPPLTSILEQSFWSESSDKYYFINKYNDQCASRNFNQSRTKSNLFKTRPSTADARLIHFPQSLMGASGEGFSQHKFSQQHDDSSRSSTPDFMREVYDEYLNLDSEQSLLLRRPVSRGDTTSDGSRSDQVCSINTSTGIPNSRKAPGPGDYSISLTDEEQNIVPLFKKTLKVAIDIPLCDKVDPLPSRALDDRLVEEVPTRCSEVSFYDNDDAQSVQSSKSNESTKLKSTPRKCRTRKKRTRSKKKIELPNVSLGYLDTESKEKSAPTPKRPVWKSSDDDVVTQMSALGLAGRPDDQLTPVLGRKASVSKCKSNREVATSTPEKKSVCTAPSSTAQKDDFFNKKRRVPIQIISDPFMHQGSQRSIHEPVKQRPQTAGTPSIRRMGGVAWR